MNRDKNTTQEVKSLIERVGSPAAPFWIGVFEFELKQQKRKEKHRGR